MVRYLSSFSIQKSSIGISPCPNFNMELQKLQTVYAQQEPSSSWPISFGGRCPWRWAPVEYLRSSFSLYLNLWRRAFAHADSWRHQTVWLACHECGPSWSLRFLLHWGSNPHTGDHTSCLIGNAWHLTSFVNRATVNHQDFLRFICRVSCMWSALASARPWRRPWYKLGTPARVPHALFGTLHRTHCFPRGSHLLSVSIANYWIKMSPVKRHIAEPSDGSFACNSGLGPSTVFMWAVFIVKLTTVHQGSHHEHFIEGAKSGCPPRSLQNAGRRGHVAGSLNHLLSLDVVDGLR